MHPHAVEPVYFEVCLTTKLVCPQHSKFRKGANSTSEGQETHPDLALCHAHPPHCAHTAFRPYPLDLHQLKRRTAIREMAFKTHHNFWIHYMKTGQTLKLQPGTSGVHYKHRGRDSGWLLGS